MSSVTRFLKQLDPAASVFSIGNLVSNSSTVVFEFVPTASNVVGNYPPGYVAPASAALQAALTAAAAAATTTGQSLVVRDMGKTIFAPVAASIAAGLPTAASTPYGSFRQVQILLPQQLQRLGQGFIGGPNGITFGVLGAAVTPDVYTNYLTVYISIPNSGISGAPISTSSVIPGNML